jgi:CDP-glycerol glycerophosphotransferase (TagB/SpsB family)
MESLSNYLKERMITIVIRPHPTDLKRQENNMSWKALQEFNDVIKIIARDEMPDVQPLLYLADCLITDYSSIQHDYFLLNRPVIYLPYDYDEYSKKVGGFNMDYDEFAPGPKPKTQAEFLSYLEMFYKKEDPFSVERSKIRDIVHKYKDGQSCKRVYELIKEMTAPVS